MSITPVEKRRTPADLRLRKGGVPIVSLTAYSTPQARLLDPHTDLLLVGDSLGMVVYGLESTLPVTLDMMIAHGAAVVRGANRACVIVDMPFGSYQESPAQAFRNAARIMAETGCAGVKFEGGEVMAETIYFLDPARHSGAQPYRPATAIGQCTRWFPRARTHRSRGRPRHRRRQSGGGGRRLRHGRRRHGRAGGAAIDRNRAGADHRHRRIGRLRRADPRHRRHSRHSSMCSGRASSSATPNSVARSRPRFRPMPRMSARGAFPGPNTSMVRPRRKSARRRLPVDQDRARRSLSGTPFGPVTGGREALADHAALDDVVAVLGLAGGEILHMGTHDPGALPVIAARGHDVGHDVGVALGRLAGDALAVR